MSCASCMLAQGGGDLAAPASPMPSPRVCVVGDGAAAWAAAYRLVRHGSAAGVAVTLLSPAGEARPASSVLGLLSRHGCPNLARWYDELHLGLVAHGAVGAAAASPCASTRRRIGAEAMALLACELRHDPDVATAAQPELDGTIADFCDRQQGDGAQEARGWLLPLVGCVWGLPPAEAAGVSARLALRVLLEGGLLVEGGDGSGHDPSVWWALRPSGGWPAVRERAREWLAAHGVPLLQVGIDEADSLSIRPGSSATNGHCVSYGQTKLGPFDHIILAMEPASAASALERGGHRTGLVATWAEALRRLGEFSVPLQLATLADDTRQGALVGEVATAPEQTYQLRNLQGAEFDSVPQQSTARLSIRRHSSVPAQTRLQGSILGPGAAVAQMEVEQLHASQLRQQGRDGHDGCSIWCAHELLQDGLLEGAVVAALKLTRSLLPLLWVADDRTTASRADANPLPPPGSPLPPAGACYTPERMVPPPPCPFDVPAWRCRLHLRFSGRTAHRRPGPPKNKDKLCPGEAMAVKSADKITVAPSAPICCPAGGAAPHTFQYDVRYDWTNVDAGYRQWWGGLVREDHFGDPAIALGEAVRAMVAQELGIWVTGPVDLLGSLRECGYCFNPICVYYCWAEVERRTLLCVVAATTNTPWGQRHLHVLPIECALWPRQDHGHERSGQAGGEGTSERNRHILRREKRLHVSPFNPPPNGKASWKYIVDVPHAALDTVSVGVTAYADAMQNQETLQVAATLALKRRRGDCGGWWWQRLDACEWAPRLPYSLLVQYRIHWQAVRLFRKGLALHDNTTCPLATRNVAISHGFMAGLVVLGFGASLWAAWQGVSMLLAGASVTVSGPGQNCSI